MRLPKIKDKVFIKTVPEFQRGNPANKYCIVDGSLLSTVFVRPKNSRNKAFDVHIDDIEFVESEIEKPRGDKRLTKEEQETIITRLVNPEMLAIAGILNREKAHLRKLAKEYNDPNFWINFAPEFQVKSLIWWLRGGTMQMKKFWTEKESQERIEKYVDIQSEKINNIVTVQVEDEKVGEDYVFVKKPKNLIDQL